MVSPALWREVVAGARTRLGLPTGTHNPSPREVEGEPQVSLPALARGGLTLRRKRPKRRRMAAERTEVPETTRPNARCAMAFVHDALASGRGLRVFPAQAVHTRECVALRAARRFTGENMVGTLGEAGAERAALPEGISVDQGTAFTSRSLGHWAY